MKTYQLLDIENDAKDIAAEMGHAFVSSEHMLLAIARSNGVGANVLQAVGVDYDRLRNTLERLLS